MNGLALCSGFGGIERGLESRIDGFKTVCHVEGEAYAVANLVKKIQEGAIHEAPVWSNVQTFDGTPWRGKVDIITGGFPCQPHSSAGKLLGEKDPRNLWPDVKRIIGEVSPRILFLENVSNINNTIGPSIVGDLAQMGFDAAWCVVRASDVGAPHRRARWFIMAHANTNSERRDKNQLNIRSRKLDVERSCGEISDTDSERSGKSRLLFERTNGKLISCSIQERIIEDWWAVEPPVGRMVDGVAHWVDRLRGCGNGVVPQQAAYAFDILSTALMNQMEGEI